MAPKYGVLALVEAKLGKEQEVWDFLNGGREVVLKEPGTRTWYAFRVNDYTFGIFDTFDTEEDRQAHLNGAIPAALGEHGPTLLSKDPDIRLIELIAVKLPAACAPAVRHCRAGGTLARARRPVNLMLRSRPPKCSRTATTM